MNSSDSCISENEEAVAEPMEFTTVNSERPSSSSTAGPMEMHSKRKLPNTGRTLAKTVKKQKSAEETSLEGEELELGEGNGINISGLSNTDNEETYATSELKRSVHGVVYQLKHLMLTLIRARKNGEAIRLATEMEAAGKFDDVVLEYTDNVTKKRTHRFVQLKHSQSKYEKITARKLMKSGGAFNIQKYFESWCHTKNLSIFSGSEVKNFILCTNIGLDIQGLEKENIKVKEVSAMDVFLEMPNCTEVSKNDQQPRRYQLIIDEDSELYCAIKANAKIIKSDIVELAEVMAKHFCDNEVTDQSAIIFEKYYVALEKEHIIDTKRKQYTRHFVRNKKLTTKVKDFRNIFFQIIKQSDSKKYVNNKDIDKNLMNFKLFENFPDKPESENESKCDDQITGLPDNEEVVYATFKAFLGELILAVEQPNEEKLGKIIEREMGDDDKVNFLDASLIKDSFLNDMLDWLKKKSGIILKDDHLDSFFEEIKAKLGSFRTMHLTLDHIEKLKEYDVQFKPDDTNLKQISNTLTEERIIKLVAHKQTLLTELMVCQVIEDFEEYKKKDSYIFIGLEKLLQPEITEIVLRAFQYPSVTNLLIINCESIGARGDAQRLWNRLNDIMESDIKKKMILIIRGDGWSAITFKIQCKTLTGNEDYDTSFNSLKEDSLQKLLEKKVVKFQGQAETSFGTLLGIPNINSVNKQGLEDLSQIITATRLVELIRGEEIVIGNEVEELGAVQDYYIPRKILQHTTINVSILTDSQIEDRFAITGIAEQALKKLLSDQTRVSITHCIFLKTRQPSNDFEKISKEHEGRNIHWLHHKSGKFLWKDSRGNISNLLAHNDKTSFTTLTEDKLLDLDKERRIVIISDVAGMGKSTVVTYLAGKMKENSKKNNNCDVFVIRINLGQHSEALDIEYKKRQHDSNPNVTSGELDFFVDKLSGLSNELEKQILKIMIKRQRGDALIFDGFDEVNSEYRPIVIDLLKKLAELKVTKLFVTTRPNIGQSLEQALRRLPCTLEPFGVTEQRSFLNKFWKKSLKSKNPDIETAKLRKHVNGVLRLLKKSINEHMKEFIGVPLQTRLVAEAFDYNTENKLPSKINIIDLFSHFVKKKLLILDERDNVLQTRSIVQQRKNKLFRDDSYKAHQELAVKALFKKDAVNMLLCQPPTANYERNNLALYASAGIFSLIKDEAQFNHQTYAEYFAAHLLFNRMTGNGVNNKTAEFFMGELFIKPQYKMIRIFLNGLLAKSTKEINKPDTKLWELAPDQDFVHDDRTVYHIAVEEGTIEIFKFISSRFKDEGINRPTSYSLDTPLHYAALGVGNLEIVDYSLKNKAKVNARNEKGDTPLHNAVRLVDNLKVVRCLISHKADIECENSAGDRPLHAAVCIPGNLNVVRHLITKKVRVNVRTKCGNTPLHLVVTELDNFKVARFLIERGAAIDSQNGIGRTPLHILVSKFVDLHMLNYLILKSGDIQFDRSPGETPLHHIARVSGNSKIVENLEKEVEDRVNRAAIRATRSKEKEDALGMVKYLIEDCKADVTIRDEEDFTPLRRAAAVFGCRDISNYLKGEEEKIKK